MKAKNQDIDKKKQLHNQLLDISLILGFILSLPFVFLFLFNCNCYYGGYQSNCLIPCIACLCYLMIALFAKKLSLKINFFLLIAIWSIVSLVTVFIYVNFNLSQKLFFSIVFAGVLIISVKIIQRKTFSAITLLDKQDQDLSNIHQEESDTQNNEKQVDLSHKLRALEKLAGGIAHDFNNLLMPIMGYTEMMLEDFSDNQDAVDNLNEILKTSIRAKNLTEQALTFSKRSIMQLELVDIVSIINETIPHLQETIPHSINIETHIESDCNYVMGDPSKLQIIIMHLCTNASHAIDKADSFISISLSKSYVEELLLFNRESLKSGNYIVLSIADSGHGIDLKIQECIFDPYFSTKEKGKGKGLGLSVVLGIVSRLNGGITFESTPGKGTCFNIFLPALEPDKNASDK
jgi:signal transduction histidine kinase